MPSEPIKIQQLRDHIDRLKSRYRYDQAEADRAVQFIEGHLCHYKRPYTGKPFVLSDWQRELLIEPLFGLINDEGLRLIRHCYLSLPRKNGKSSLAAAILLYVLMADGHGIEIYTAANKRDQARIIYNDCSQFLRASPALRKRLEANKTEIKYDKRASYIRPLSSDYNSMDGLNVYAACIDEIHATRDRQIVDVITSAVGARDQSLILYTTTAGIDNNGVGFEKYDYSCKVLDQTIDDDTWLPLIAEADPDLSWDDPAAYRQANLNLDISVSEDYLSGELQRAIASSSYRATYQRYSLNRWVHGGGEAWISPDAWARCQGSYSLDDLRGRDIYVGLDLASVEDIAAVAILASDGSRLRCSWRLYCPEANLPRMAARHRVPYEAWAADGWITPTPGETVDYDYIEADILQLRDEYNLRVVSYDDWQSNMIASRLTAEGVQCIKFVQGVRSFHAPTVETERLILAREIEHDGNPAARWMLSNTKIKTDASGKVRPIKSTLAEKIDSTVALIMAVDAHTRLTSTPEDSGNDIDYQALPSDLRAVMGI